MLDVLLGVSWGLSMVFMLAVGFILGQMKAHRDSLAKIEAVKSGVIQLFAGGKNAIEKTFPGLADSHGGPVIGGRSQQAQEIEA
jgi:hypothetical protein